MRLGIVTTSFPRFKGDHAGAFIYNLARQLVLKGHETVVVAPHDPGVPTSEVMDGILVKRFTYALPRRWQKLCYQSGIRENLRQHWWTVFQLPALLLAAVVGTWRSCSTCQILHAYWSLPGLAAIIVGAVCGKPVFVTTFGIEVFIDHPLNRLLTGFVLKSAHMVIAISQYTRQRILQIGSPRSIEVIPFGVDRVTNRTSNAASELRRRLGIPQETKIILALGRLVRRKGFHHLIDAMSHITSQVPACLVIGGSGPERSELQAQAARLGLDGVVFLPGFIAAADLPLYYQGCDVFVLPSVVDAAGDTEGLGMVLLEAQAYGKPVIGSQVGGIVDVIKDNVTGFLVEPGGTSSLAERIVTVLSDSDLAARMGEAGQKHVELFAWDRITDRLIDLYRLSVS